MPQPQASVLDVFTGWLYVDFFQSNSFSYDNHNLLGYRNHFGHRLHRNEYRCDNCQSAAGSKYRKQRCHLQSCVCCNWRCRGFRQYLRLDVQSGQLYIQRFKPFCFSHRHHNLHAHANNHVNRL